MTRLAKKLRFGSKTTALKSIGWASADAVGRVVLLASATIILSRIIAAEDFGISAIVLAIAVAAGFFVGTPFEEALVQRRVLRTADLRSAFSVSMLIGIILVLITVPAASWLAGIYNTPEMALLLPVTMLSVFFNGHGDLATALARRRRRFDDIAAASLISHAVGVCITVILAVCGFGVWALIGMRLVIVAVRSIVLQHLQRYPLLPLLSLQSLRSLAYQASISFFDRLTENLTYLVFANLVGLFHGLTAVGYLNMALRVVEPIRGAIVATMHNLSFPYFRNVALGTQAPAARDHIIHLLAFVITAVFAGLAAIMPALIPLVAGPGWQDAIFIAICLSVGGAIVLPTRLISTALIASGKPIYSLYGNFAALILATVLLLLSRDAPDYVIGLARTFADLGQALIAIAVPLVFVHWTSTMRLRLIAPAWFIATLMGGVVFLIGQYLGHLNHLGVLIIQIGAGVLIHICLMGLFCKRELRQILSYLRGRAVEVAP